MIEKLAENLINLKKEFECVDGVKNRTTRFGKLTIKRAFEAQYFSFYLIEGECK